MCMRNKRFMTFGEEQGDSRAKLATDDHIVVKFKTFRIKFKKVQKSSRKNKVHKSS